MEQQEKCKFEDKIMDFVKDIAEIKATVNALDKRINGAMDGIATHIEHGNKWRLAIVGSILAVIIHALLFAYMCGRLVEKVNRNFDAINYHIKTEGKLNP